MNIPKELKYMESHEWAKNEGGNIRVGVSDYAQHEITDVVHVELPAVGKKVEFKQPCAVIESVKAAFDIYAPVSGEIIAVNEKLDANPELVNKAPYTDGYFFVIKPSNPSELSKLMSSEDYKKTLTH